MLGQRSDLVRRAGEAMDRSKNPEPRVEGATEMSIQSSRLDQQSPDHQRAGEDVVRVLLADDDRELRRMLAGELRKEGFVVNESGTGFELLEQLGSAALRAHPVDLIVTDIRMPGVSGLAVVEGLRNGSKCGGWATPIILITAFGDAEAHAEASRLGAVLLDKPFDLGEFRAHAKRMVSPAAAA